MFDGEYLSALESRLTTTCRRRSMSAWTGERFAVGQDKVDVALAGDLLLADGVAADGSQIADRQRQRQFALLDA